MTQNLSAYYESGHQAVDTLLCYWDGRKFHTKHASEFSYDELMKQRYIMAEHATASPDEEMKNIYRHEIDLYNEEIDLRAEIRKAKRELAEKQHQDRVKSVMETIYR